ncbi:hypothetical protein F7725_020860 [Dissostichus mawsoni]|uniref:Uncharacterized protein n=1 Tax=Dissostichus mawsoni TaxID=36200 RepID=A0A7J5YED4_DISMA|nr:hypothetical protein F7725_020860 [Dissostichus mawsoni]
MNGPVVFQMWTVLLLGTITGVCRAQVATAKVLRGNIRRDGVNLKLIGAPQLSLIHLSLWIMRDSKTNGNPNGQSIKEEMEESITDRGVEGRKDKVFLERESGQSLVPNISRLSDLRI